MPKVTFLPVNKTVEAEEGQSLLDVAMDNDIRLEHNCGGNCACSTCHVIVKEGMEKLSQKTEEEQDELEEAEGLTPTSRLGCQSKIYGDITVEIPPYHSTLLNEDVTKIESLIKEKEKALNLAQLNPASNPGESKKE
jgi:2Fe-2S ferredoxin